MPTVREPGATWRDPARVPPRLAVGSVVNNHIVLAVTHVEMFRHRRYDKYLFRSICCEYELERSEKQLTNSTYTSYAKAGCCPHCKNKHSFTATTLRHRRQLAVVTARMATTAFCSPLAFAALSAPAPASSLAFPFPWH